MTLDESKILRGREVHRMNKRNLLDRVNGMLYGEGEIRCPGQEQERGEVILEHAL